MAQQSREHGISRQVFAGRRADMQQSSRNVVALVLVPGVPSSSEQQHAHDVKHEADR
jgi:hypothetical protein